MKKNIIVVTGGAGFIGSNLIKLFLEKTKFKIISIDNYSSGSKKNHIRNHRVKYIKSDTKNLSNILFTQKKK
jgi:UDP-glucose 4-epimerase